MKKFLRRTIPLLIPILLLALFSRVPLAQPEQTVPEEARLVGYYLLPDELVPPNWESAENGWEEYSPHSLYQWLRTHPSAPDCSESPERRGWAIPLSRPGRPPFLPGPGTEHGGRQSRGNG